MNKKYLTYPEWQATADTLHMILQIAGKIKLERSYQNPEWAHARLYLTIDGLTTGIIPGDSSAFEIFFNFRKHHVEVRNAENQYTLIPLKEGLTVADFYAQLNKALEYIGSPTAINTRSQEFYDFVELDKDTKHYAYDEKSVVYFLDNMIFAYQALNKFVAPFRGKIDYPAYYFGTMDLSCILYSGEPAPYGHAGAITPHTFDERCCEFGFWPGDVRSSVPAFYVLPYPFISSIEEYEEMLKPQGAIFLPEKKEFFLPLQDAFCTDKPIDTCVTFFESCFDILQKLQKWEHLEWFTTPLTYPK